MAQYYMQSMVPHDALTGQYSVLHQERLYLLQALAKEETQGERLTQALTSLQAQIHASEVADPQDTSNRLKQLRHQVKAVRNKIGACQNRERALAMNVSSIVAQMESVKRYHLFNAQQEYAMQLAQAQQHAHMVLMSPARPAFALRSPANVDLATQMQYMSLTPSPGPVFGGRASLDPYMGAPNQAMPYSSADFSRMAAGQYQVESSPERESMIAWPGFVEASNASQNIPSTAAHTSDACISPTRQDWANAKSAVFSRQRASSMLDTVPESQALHHRYAPSSALRRLSLLDGSAALKLERKAAEEQARRFGGWQN